MRALRFNVQLPPMGRKAKLSLATLGVTFVIYISLLLASSIWPNAYHFQGTWGIRTHHPPTTDDTSISSPSLLEKQKMGSMRDPNVNYDPFGDDRGKCKKSEKIWKEEILVKTDKLLTDKFTIVFEVFDDPMVLQTAINLLLDIDIPSLHEIVIVWNDQAKKHPENFTSKHNVTVRYSTADYKSPNTKLSPDRFFETQAVLISDAKAYYQPSDMEFAFQTWRRFGQDKIVGAKPRCVVTNENREWRYTPCNQNSDTDLYSMIGPTVSFVHVSFLHYYYSRDPTMVEVRKYVDEHADCESIALNFVVSMLKQSGPLLAIGYSPWVDQSTQGETPTQLDVRSQCVADFVIMFGCMPLYGETVRMVRGNGLG